MSATGVAVAKYNPEEERTKLRDWAFDFTHEGTRPIPFLGMLPDDVISYPAQDLRTAYVKRSTELPYTELDGEPGTRQTRHIGIQEKRDLANKILPGFEETIVKPLAESPLPETIAAGVQEGRSYGILTGHDVLFDIMLEQVGLQCAVADVTNEGTAETLTSQSALIANKIITELEMLVMLDDRPVKVAAIDALALVGHVFLNIPPSDSRLKLGISDTLTAGVGVTMLRSISRWRKQATLTGLGTNLAVAPSAKNNSGEGVRLMAPGLEAVASLMKSCVGVVPIGTVFDRNTFSIHIEPGEMHPPEESIQPDMIRIRNLSNQCAQKVGSKLTYQLAKKSEQTDR